MRRLLVVAIVAVIGLMAGAALAGAPSSVPDDLVIESAPSTTEASRQTLPGLPPASAPRPSSPVTDPTTEASAPTTTEAPQATTTTVGPTTTTAAWTTTTTMLAAPATIKVTAVNAADAAGIAGSHAETLAGLGYADPVATDATASHETSGVYFAPGFDTEAERLANQLDIPTDAVQPGPPPDIAENDTDSDLWVMLGMDRAD